MGVLGEIAGEARALLMPHRRVVPRNVRPWGDGIAERSLATLGYGATWSDVDTDELVQFLPALGAGTGCGAAGPLTRLLRRLLVERAGAVRCWLRTAIPADDCDTMLIESGALSSIHHRTGDAPARWRGRHSPSGWPGRVDPDTILFELAVLAAIDRLHGACLMGGTAPAPRPADALIASIHTRVNAAYVHPQFAIDHELLTTGCWLGQLIAGRPAIMTPLVASRLADIGRDAACDEVLALHVALSGHDAASLRRRVGQVVNPGSRRPPPVPSGLRVVDVRPVALRLAQAGLVRTS